MESNKSTTWPIQLTANYDYNENILNSLGLLLNYYTEKHGKTLVVRFDIRYPQHYDNTIKQSDISRCMQKLIQKYKRQGYDPSYMWVREQNHSPYPHYHCLILLNGNLVKSYHHIFVSAEQFWGSTIGVPSAGLVDHCTVSKGGRSHENGIMLRRCDDNYTDRYCAVQQQVSYIAKAKDKGEPNDGLRDFGMSRLPVPS